MAFYTRREGLSADPHSISRVEIDSPPQHPSTYWAQPGDRKPTVSVYVEAVGVLYSRISTMLNDSAKNDVLLASYLWAFIKAHPEVFGMVDATAWAEECPIWPALAPAQDGAVHPPRLPTDVLREDIVAAPQPPPEPNGGAVETWARFCAILGLYRKALTRALSVEHGTTVAAKINSTLRPLGLGGAERQEEYDRWVAYITDDILDINLVKVICAIDMFYVKYPRSPAAFVRVATLSSRYRGCVALTSFCGIADLVGLTPGELTHFVYTMQVGKELQQITQPGDHADKINGYFPYHLGLNLVQKSAYSQTANKTLYFWCHVIGSLMGSPRSLNAKFLDCMDLPATVQSAIAVAFHFNLGGLEGTKMTFFQSAAKAEAYNRYEADVRAYQQEMYGDPLQENLPVDQLIDLPEEQPANNRAPGIQRPNLPELNERELEALAVCEELAQGITEAQWRAVAGKCANMNTQNEGTVGRYLRTTYGGLRR